MLINIYRLLPPALVDPPQRSMTIVYIVLNSLWPLSAGSIEKVRNKFLFLSPSAAADVKV